MSAQGDQTDWTRHRREVFAAKEQALHAARQAEHERATALIREAVDRFREAGIAPIPLRARPYTGSGTDRTGHTGWYLKQDPSHADDAERRYYLRRVERGMRARWRGASPEPSPAPLVVGRGARDGDTFELQELLEMRLQDPVRP